MLLTRLESLQHVFRKGIHQKRCQIGRLQSFRLDRFIIWLLALPLFSFPARLNGILVKTKVNDRGDQLH